MMELNDIEEDICLTEARVGCATLVRNVVALCEDDPELESFSDTPHYSKHWWRSFHDIGPGIPNTYGWRCIF